MSVLSMLTPVPVQRERPDTPSGPSGPRVHPPLPWTLAIAVLLVFAATVRLINLGAVPPFVDEDGYSTYAQAVSQVPWKYALRHPDELAPLTGDKPPLAIVLQAALNARVDDLVVAGRLLSAVAGIAAAALCYPLGRRLGGRWVGLVAVAVYACSPLATLHERVVQQDPLMSVFSLAGLLVAWTAMERASVGLALVAGLLGGIAVQFKVTGLVTAPLMLSLVVLGEARDWRSRLLPVVSAAIVGASYALLITGPGSANLSDQNQKLLVPLAYVTTNLEVLRDSIATYFPYGLPVLALVGLGVGLGVRPRPTLLCAVAIVVWVAPWVLLSRFAPSRYYLAADPYASGLIALGLVWLVASIASLGRAAQLAAVAVASLLLLGSAAASVRLATDFLHAPLSQLDDCQFRSCWPSGYPYRAAHDYIVSSVAAGSTLAYMVDVDHRIALELDRPTPSGVESLGIVKQGASLPVDGSAPLYVVVDDVRDSEPGSGLRELQHDYPQLVLVAQFLRPGSNAGVSIVSTRSTASSNADR
jgi:Dolichyl-phosphate-mannose-protein mannosyltransferase